jgi:hypothetical protein
MVVWRREPDGRHMEREVPNDVVERPAPLSTVTA